MGSFLGLEWGDVIEGLIRVVGVLPTLFGIALGVALFLVAFAWLTRRDPIIKAQAETIQVSANLILTHTKAVESYNQQVIDLQNQLDAAKDTHANQLKELRTTHQAAIEQLGFEIVRVKKDLKEERDGRTARELELQGEIDRLARELAEARAKADQLTAQLTEATAAAEALKAQVTQLQSTLLQDKELISSLQMQIEDYCHTIERLEIELGRLRHELAEAQAAKDAAEAKLEEERRQMQEQIEQLRARLDKTETAELTAEVTALSPADESADPPTVSTPSEGGNSIETKEVSDV